MNKCYDSLQLRSVFPVQELRMVCDDGFGRCLQAKHVRFYMAKSRQLLVQLAQHLA